VSHPILEELLAATAEERPVALVTVVAGPDAGGKALVSPSGVTGSLGDAGLDRAAIGDARAMLAQGASGTRHYGRRGEERGDEVEVFIQSFAPPPRMYVFGAIDFSRATVRMGKLLGYHVSVIDARATFATVKRFPEADEVVVAWPHEFLATAPVEERTVLCILTHDPKFDVPVLAAAVRTPAAYIGAMGSRTTHIDRMRRLRDAGVAEGDLERIHGPIGLDIGARTPEEVAVAIAAEIIALRYGREAPSLSDRSGPVHLPLATAVVAAAERRKALG
jgi:xanthine dehydrogenase accessory factor